MATKKHSGTKNEGDSPSAKIDRRIAELGDWRGEMLAKLRAIITGVEPGIVEEWKWMGTPVWEKGGIICTGESYKAVVKLTFAKGAALKDPKGLFNSSLDGNVRRAIDVREGEKIDASALKALVKEAIALNAAGKAAKKPAAKKAPAKKKAAAKKAPAKAKKRSA